MEETMKCIKNKSNGNIIRVEDRVAYNMVGREWDYTSKSEWKSQFKKVETPKTENNEQDRSK
jgi:hypothetical protein